MSEEQSLKSEKKSESEASVPGEKTGEREREGGREGALLSLHNQRAASSSHISHRCKHLAQLLYHTHLGRKVIPRPSLRGR